MKKIIIPDYGSGNYASIVRMVEKVGGQAEIVLTPRKIQDNEKIIMAGVGAFDNGMSHLRESGWDKILDEAVQFRKVPVLGICLGMQLMCNGSEEGTAKGLGWIDATVKHFVFPEDSSLKVPHMGWNTLSILKPNKLIPPTSEELRYYFTHSYFVTCSDQKDAIATCDHGFPFVASFWKENIYGVQFHPEKSHRFGMALIESFVKNIGED